VKAAGTGVAGAVLLGAGVAVLTETWVGAVVVVGCVSVVAAAALAGVVYRAWLAFDVLAWLADEAVLAGSETVSAEEVARMVESVFPAVRGERRRVAWEQIRAVLSEEGLR
jgi:hypothetical protein